MKVIEFQSGYGYAIYWRGDGAKSWDEKSNESKVARKAIRLMESTLVFVFETLFAAFSWDGIKEVCC